jgi:hypothetical protein
MVTLRTVGILMIALAGVAPTAGADDQTPSQCAKLLEAKLKTYGFHPSKLSAAEQKTKSAQLDHFGDLVKAEGPNGLECLARLIADEKSDTYFLFDAASILVTLDKSGGSDTAIVSGLSRTDLADVDPAGFIEVALQVSKRGADIGPAAHNYMNAKDVTTYLPAHGAYKLDRVSGTILLYGGMPTDKVDDYLAVEVGSVKADTRNAAAAVWSLNMTEASFKGLAALGEMTGFSKGTREQVRTVRRYVPVSVSKRAKYTRDQMLQKIALWPEFGDDPSKEKALDNAFYATLGFEDLSTVREARRRVITGVSNESIEAYSEVSRMLMNLINVLDAYKEYRVH